MQEEHAIWVSLSLTLEIQQKPLSVSAGLMCTATVILCCSLLLNSFNVLSMIWARKLVVSEKCPRQHCRQLHQNVSIVLQIAGHTAHLL